MMKKNVRYLMRTAMVFASIFAGVFGASPAQAAIVSPVVSVTESYTTPIDGTTGLYTDSTTHTVKLPSTIQSGELMVLLLTFDGAPSVTPPSGWTQLWMTSAGTALTAGAYYRIATSANEGQTTAMFTTSVAEKGVAQMYKIANWHGAASDIAIGTPVVSTVSSPGGTTADAPLLSPSWGSARNIWITAAHMSSSRTIISGPTGYSAIYSTRSGEDTTAGQLGSAYKVATSATEDPDVFTFSGAGVSSVANTIAIAPGPQVDQGKILEQYEITQSGTTYFVPMYVSRPTSTTDTSVRRVIIVSHGASLNAEDYFNYIRDNIGGASNVVVVAPQFAEDQANPAVGQLFLVECVARMWKVKFKLYLEAELMRSA